MPDKVVYPDFKKELEDYIYVCDCGCSQFHIVSDTNLECVRCYTTHPIKDVMEIGF